MPAVFDFDDVIKMLLICFEFSMFSDCGKIYCYSNNTEKNARKIRNWKMYFSKVDS